MQMQHIIMVDAVLNFAGNKGLSRARWQLVCEVGKGDWVRFVGQFQIRQNVYPIYFQINVLSFFIIPLTKSVIQIRKHYA